MDALPVNGINRVGQELSFHLLDVCSLSAEGCAVWHVHVCALFVIKRCVHLIGDAWERLPSNARGTKTSAKSEVTSKTNTRG